MYKVLLVDDEAIVLRGLLSQLSWEKMECKVVATATDGEEAYRLALEYKPDIVITDVKMPGRSGLELIESLQPHLQAAYIVFSGYSDFQYAKEALRLATVDYLLKPIDTEEIERTIQTAKERLNQMKSRAFMEVKKDALIANGINRLLEGEDHQLELLEPYHAFSVISLKLVSSDEQFSLLSGVLDSVSSLCSSTKAIYTVKRRYSAHLVVCSVSNDEIYEFLRSIQSRIEQCRIESPGSFFWGMGDIVHSQLDLSLSFVTANSIVDYSCFTNEQIPKKTEFADLDKKTYDELIDQIVHTFFQGEASFQTEESLDNLFERMLFERLSIKDVRNVCGNLAVIARYLANHQYKELNQQALNSIPEISEIVSCGTIEDIQQLFRKMIQQFQSGVSKDISKSKSSAIVKIREYVEQNISVPITLYDLARLLGMSESYISHLFRKETGTALFDYITGCKMEQAKKLIREGNLKIGDIARQVGFEDQRYFSQVFKKRVGMTALEYRESK